MMAPDLLHAAVIFGAALAAGAINSVAGGGTLITFPTLIWAGLPSVTANATNTVAIWPGSLGAAWGYREELSTANRRLLMLVVPSLLGGLAGAMLLARTPPGVFDRIVPYLVLGATGLFMVQHRVQRMTAPTAAQGYSVAWIAGASAFQFAVGVYGGYFGAGIGILMLAALGVLGMRDIHQMNGLKNVFAVAVNGVAALYFIAAHMVHWPDALVMATGAIAGGYGCVGIARRLGARTVSRIVVAIGLLMTVALLLRR